LENTCAFIFVELTASILYQIDTLLIFAIRTT